MANSKAIGVAFSDQAISGGTIDNTVIGISAAAGTVGFYGTTPIAQRAAAIMTATSSLFVLTGASFVANTSTTLSGFIVLNTTLASQLMDALQEIRAAQVALGLIKGGA